MARPSKQTVDYFPHDTDASINSRTLKILENKFGNDGYTFWYKLLELLGRKDGHFIDIDGEDGLEYLASETKIKDIETLKEMLDILVRRQSIDKELYEHGIIWCQNFVDRITDAYRNRKTPLPQKPNLNNVNNQVSDTENSIPDSDNPQIKLNKTKVNNIEDRDDLYKILEETKGFPKHSQENIWKLEDVIKDYPNLDYLREFKKFREYWNTRKLKRPWLALRNWLGRAKENVGKTRNPRELPKGYTDSPDYPD